MVSFVVSLSPSVRRFSVMSWSVSFCFGLFCDRCCVSFSSGELIVSKYAKKVISGSISYMVDAIALILSETMIGRDSLVSEISIRAAVSCLFVMFLSIRGLWDGYGRWMAKSSPYPPPGGEAERRRSTMVDRLVRRLSGSWATGGTRSSFV
eukprot:Pompholyxophrys_punicea_v1_NODE_25_length_5265_cov_107.938388.p7 type:complete len:151 gc:universal NODE_25_length_5265_cov_107.938388:3553-3101(-)